MNIHNHISLSYNFIYVYIYWCSKRHPRIEQSHVHSLPTPTLTKLILKTINQQHPKIGWLGIQFIIFILFYFFPSTLNKYSPGSFFLTSSSINWRSGKLRFPLWNYLFVSLSWEHPEVTNFKSILPKSA